MDDATRAATLNRIVENNRRKMLDVMEGISNLRRHNTPETSFAFRAAVVELYRARDRVWDAQNFAATPRI
jgi:hypothetical protein